MQGCFCFSLPCFNRPHMLQQQTPHAADIYDRSKPCWSSFGVAFGSICLCQCPPSNLQTVYCSDMSVTFTLCITALDSNQPTTQHVVSCNALALWHPEPAPSMLLETGPFIAPLHGTCLTWQCLMLILYT